MSTVFNRISEYEKYSKFKFNAKGRNVVGMMTAREWREKYHTTFNLIFTQSIEPGGTFTVYDYPQDFDEVIDKTILLYVEKCLHKKINGKPIQNPAHPISYSSDSQKKVRKRKPINSPPSKPTFSGKKLINKK